MTHRRIGLALPLALIAATAGLASAQERALHKFTRQQLNDTYYSEGLGVGDLNRDGKPDVVYGPYWYAGPDFRERKEIYPARPQDRNAYADHFFAWVHDFDGDGWGDVLTVGFPGTPAYVYKNPGLAGHASPWHKHPVLAQVCNESPQFTDIAGDARPELACSKGGYFGYATY